MIIMGIATWFALDILTIDNWLVFISAATLYTVIYFVLSFIFMMNQYERDIIMIPAKKVLRKLRILK